MTIISEEDAEKALRAATEVQEWLDGGCSSWGVPEQAIQRLVRRVQEGLSRDAKDEKPEPHILEIGFAEFWRVYPEKKAKLAAQKAYKAALKRGADHDQIIAGVYRYIKAKEDWCKWAMPASWLNSGRYDDGLEVYDAKDMAVAEMTASIVSKVAIDQDSETFRAITRLRNHTAPFTGRDGKAWVSAEEIERAKNV